MQQAVQGLGCEFDTGKPTAEKGRLDRHPEPRLAPRGCMVRDVRDPPRQRRAEGACGAICPWAQEYDACPSLHAVPAQGRQADARAHAGDGIVLKALGLQDHQAVLAAHHDKEHLHVHIVVNTVNPDTGITAGLKFTKLDLSKWAEAYEREFGIHCQERVKNNAERDRHARKRRREPSDLLMGRKGDANAILMSRSRSMRPRASPTSPSSTRRSAASSGWRRKTSPTG
jgi:hypothetical protein